MSFKTLIVETHEPLARKVLREELESIADVEIVGEAEDGAGALAKNSQGPARSSCWIYRCRAWADWTLYEV